MYITTDVGLGQDPMMKSITDFLNQVRKEPQKFKKLLLTVALHPDDAAVISGEEAVAPDAVFAALREISEANFKKEINDGLCLQALMIYFTRNLHYVLYQAYLFQSLLLPQPVGSGFYEGVTKIAQHFVDNVLPKDLAKQIRNSGDASEAHLARLGSFFRSHAENLEQTNINFKKVVDVARRQEQEREQRKKREEEGRKRQQPPKPPGRKAPVGQGKRK